MSVAPEEQANERLRGAFKLGAVVVVVALLVLAQRLGVFQQFRDPEHVRETLVQLGPWGYLAFIMAYATLQPFGVPGTVFVMAAPLIWPWPVAFALSMVGTMAASVVGFSFARFVARDWISRRIPQRFRKYDEALAKRAFRTVFLLRFIFWMPPLLHAFFGVSKVRFSTHFWGSFAGYLVPLFVVSFFGARLFEAMRQAPPEVWAGLVATVVAVGLTVWLVIIAAERALPPVIAPGIIEEAIKVIPLVLVLVAGVLLSHRMQREYGLREPLDGIILAAASATGFAFLETMFVYVPKYGALISAPRLLVNLFGHIAYGGSFGYFIGLAALRHRRAIPAVIAVAIGFALANLLHDLWDAMRFYDGGLAIISPIHEVVIAILCFVILGSLIMKAREMSPEREFLWPFGSLLPYRAPEVEPLPAMPVLPGDIWLMIAGRRLSLTETTHLTVRDIPCLSAPAADGIVAEVREHPDDPSVLVLRNLSKNIWEAVLPDGNVRTIEPAGTVRLLAGTRLVFGTQSGVILITSTEIGADPRAKPEEEWC